MFTCNGQTFDVDGFYINSANNDIRRYKSWEICFSKFKKARKEKNNGKKVDIDNLALHLSFFLASYGMYRGSSFLLETNYTVHIPVVEIILDDKFTDLWGIDYVGLINKIDLLFDLKTDIEQEYRKTKQSLSNSGVNTYTDNISQTLVSKVIMGTIGCVPAYDTYFCNGVGKVNLGRGAKTFGKDSVELLVKFYKKYYDDLEIQRNNIKNISGVCYPQMKILDMGFFNIGS